MSAAPNTKEGLENGMSNPNPLLPTPNEALQLCSHLSTQETSPRKERGPGREIKCGAQQSLLTLRAIHIIYTHNFPRFCHLSLSYHCPPPFLFAVVWIDSEAPPPPLPLLLQTSQSFPLLPRLTSCPQYLQVSQLCDQAAGAPMTRDRNCARIVSMLLNLV